MHLDIVCERVNVCMYVFCTWCVYVHKCVYVCLCACVCARARVYSVLVELMGTWEQLDVNTIRVYDRRGEILIILGNNRLNDHSCSFSYVIVRICECPMELYTGSYCWTIPQTCWARCPFFFFYAIPGRSCTLLYHCIGFGA